jgi:hypothetical protein
LVLVVPLLLILLAAWAAPAAARQPVEVIVLPGASSAEGIAAGRGTTIRLRPDLSSGVVEEIINGNLFQTPTMMARFGRRLVAVNAKFDTGFPPTADQYEVVVVDRDCAS